MATERTKTKVPNYNPDELDRQIAARFDGLLMIQRGLAQRLFYDQSITECEKILSLPSEPSHDCSAQHPTPEPRP
jgi:hypothetical protein